VLAKLASLKQEEKLSGFLERFSGTTIWDILAITPEQRQ
jgi:hypothetical protein